jgi:hypothetical protein
MEEMNDYSRRMEKRIDDLRLKWAGTDFEIVLERLEMQESWKNDQSEVKEALGKVP